MMKQTTMGVIEITGQPDACRGTLMNSAEDLVERARRGDEEAFRLIFERYGRPVISFIYDMVGERGLAEELTQETFVRAYRSLNAFRDEARISTWLFGIAKNVAREALRARHKENSKVGITDQIVINLPDGQPAPDCQLLDKELNGVIREALKTLDEDKRLVFTLKVFQQRSYEEIAEITGFSPAKLKTDLHRARMEMRRLVSPYMGVKQ